MARLIQLFSLFLNFTVSRQMIPTHASLDGKGIRLYSQESNVVRH